MSIDIFKDVRNRSAVEIKHFIEKKFDASFYINQTIDANKLINVAAIHAGNVKVVEVLVTMGADVNLKDKSGFTPLHFAGDAEIVELLVHSGANLDAKDEHGITPLHCATYHGNIEAAKALVLKGANIHAKGSNGKSLISWAKKGGDETMIQFITSLNIMDDSFLDVLKIIVEKHGKGPFLDIGMCRGYVADYARRSYKAERRCLFKAVEAGVSRAILGAGIAGSAAIQSCLEQQHRKLQEELGMDSVKSIYTVDILGQIMWGVQFNG